MHIRILWKEVSSTIDTIPYVRYSIYRSTTSSRLDIVSDTKKTLQKSDKGEPSIVPRPSGNEANTGQGVYLLGVVVAPSGIHW